MTILKPRNRMISVRISEEEYKALRRVCLATGARSVSDLTRDAMRVFLSGVNRDDMRDSPMDEFRTEIRNLNRKFSELSAEITASKVGTSQ